MNPITLSLHPAMAMMELAPVETGATARSDVKSTARGGASPALGRVLGALQASGLAAGTLATARGALQKMERAASLLGGADSLESGLAALLAAQARQADQRTTLAKSQAICKLQELKLKNLAEREQIEKRLEAARSAGFWSKLITAFKAIGAALSAASSIFTGPAGIAASALLVLSIIVSAAKPDDWGKWLSLGLSLAAMALGGYAAISNLVGTAASAAGTVGAAAGAAGGSATGAVGSGASAAGSAAAQATTQAVKAAAEVAAQAAKTAAEAVQSGVKLAAQIGGSASQAVAAGGAFAKGHYESEGLLAQAALAELRALRQKLLGEAEDEREEMTAVIEAQDRGVKAVVRALESYHSAALSATGRQS